jgi:ribosomal protein S18 acetylase RimI-like enzyme
VDARIKSGHDDEADAVLLPHEASSMTPTPFQMKPSVLVRPARSDDLSAVRDLLVTTWHDAYDALIGARKVTEITDSWHSMENLARQLAVPDTSFLVAEEEAAIVRHAFANAQRPPVLFPTRLYVRPDRQRRGIGARLLAEAIERHRACDRVTLEAKAGNHPALAFYRRQGFRSVGEKIVEGMPHFELEKALAAP